MSIERWGSLSVADHNDITALIANVLLYDRLIMPMYTECGDRDEKVYWEKMGWNPEAQLDRRHQLNDLVIPIEWDKNKRAAYKDRYSAAVQLDGEANGEMVTRWLLTEDQKYDLPEGVNHADIFVAYNSRLSTQEDVPINKIDMAALDDESKIAVLIAHELGIPDIEDREVALREAIDLSREQEFRIKREDLYDFQMTCLNRGMSAKAIIAELKDRNHELNNYLERQKIPIRKKAGFMLAQTLIGAVGGAFGSPAAAIGGLLSIWQFKHLDASPDAQYPNRLMPVAAFHDIEKEIGLRM